MTALYIVLIILAIIMLVIFIPVDCVIDVSYNPDKNRGNIILKYAFVKFTILPATPKEKKDIKEAKKDVEKEIKKEERDIKNIFNLIKTVYTELKDDIINVIKHLIKHTICIKAVENGCKFDGWGEHFKFDTWMQTFDELGIDPDFYTARERSYEEVLPWEHIDVGVTKKFLMNENEKAKQAVTTPNCRQQCSGCGVASFGGGVCYE